MALACAMACSKQLALPRGLGIGVQCCHELAWGIPPPSLSIGVSYKRSASFFASGLIASTPQGHIEYMIRTNLSPLRTIIMEPAASNA